MVQCYRVRRHVRSPRSNSNAKARSLWRLQLKEPEMANLDPSKQKRGLVVIDGAMALIVILLIVQIWLLNATLETYLAGHSGAVVPAAIFSGILFSACLALNLFVDRIDQVSRRS